MSLKPKNYRNKNATVGKQRVSLNKENALLLREAKKIVQALGKMFAPCCEVVLHDLRNPSNSIIAIECALSGRKVGQSVTEMGLARIRDASFPDIVQNYSNFFPDGRPAKSTSIGIRNSQNRYVAAICLNLDLSTFIATQRVVEQLARVDTDAIPITESLRTRSIADLQEAIQSYAAKYNLQPRSLDQLKRNEIINLLHEQGLLQLRNAVTTTAKILGISRASVYNALNKINVG